MALQSPPRGAKSSPPVAMAAAAPLPLLLTAPPNFITLPTQMSFWGNDQYGDCVSAEEAFAKACGNPSVFIPENDVIAWAKRHNYLNGAVIVSVIETMQRDGFLQGGSRYNDGAHYSVNWASAAALRDAITVGPVKLGIAANQVETAWKTTNGQTGWVGVGFQNDNIVDHCVSLCGYGSMAWLAQALHVPLPNGINGNLPGFAMFTWNSIGIVDQQSVLAIAGEAWVRNPTTVVRPVGVPVGSALLHPNGKAYFFRGNQYLRYDFGDLEGVDKDGTVGVDGWPGVWSDVGASLVRPNGNAYFFKGNQYQRFVFGNGEHVDKIGTIGVNGWTGVWNDIDAAIVHPNGNAYFFKGNQYQRFVFGSMDKVDKVGTIGVNGWTGLWSDLDAALMHPNGKAYFFKGSQYQRFDFASNQVDKVGFTGIDGWVGL